MVFHHPVRFGSHKHCGIGDVSWTMFALEMLKKRYFSYSNSCKEDRVSHQKHESFTFELPLIKLSGLDKYKAAKNIDNSKRYIFSKRLQKLKNIFTFHDYLPQFALKIETS